MNEAVLNMLKKYQCISQQDYKNALKEIIQEIALLGFWRSKFFEKGAFYGGTALRILFELDRFSEDLDFSLLSSDPAFDLAPYQRAVQVELESFGFKVSVEQKVKTRESAIVSAFLKANTFEHLLKIQIPALKKLHSEELIKVKLEIDTDPPPQFSTTVHYLLHPIPFSVKTLSEPDLFAGKVHALLYRSWKSRVKGRDWYDFVWFVARRSPLHLRHLEQRARQSGHYAQAEPLTEDLTKEWLHHKIENLDIQQAKQDILPFIREDSKIAVWSPDFFHALVNKIHYLNN
jgi:predicted nucleotidyltransferase component of viral defense system